MVNETIIKSPMLLAKNILNQLFFCDCSVIMSNNRKRSCMQLTSYFKRYEPLCETDD